MNLPARIGIVALVLGAFAGSIAILSSGGKTEGAGGGAGTGAATTRWESSTQCRDCHRDVYDEWFGSHHQISFTNPEVRTTSDDFRKEECMDCHLPRPLAVTGFGNRTLPRRTHFDEGVGCITCHLGPDGGILGRQSRPDAPCNPGRQHRVPGRRRLRQLATTSTAPPTSGGPARSPHKAPTAPPATCRRSSASAPTAACAPAASTSTTAPTTAPTLQQAARFTISKDSIHLVLTLQNTGAGHNFPTEERHRAVDMVYRFVTADGAGEWQRAYRFRKSVPRRDHADQPRQRGQREHAAAGRRAEERAGRDPGRRDRRRGAVCGTG